MQKKNSSRHIAYCSTLPSHSPSVAIATAPSRREPSHKSLLLFLFIYFFSSLIGKASFEPRDDRVVLESQKSDMQNADRVFLMLRSYSLAQEPLS